MAEMVPIGTPDTLPKAAPYRSGRQKYPWAELKPGEWFKFSGNVKPGSARVMAANMGNAYAVRFHVFVGEDGDLYCRRVDGLPAADRWVQQERDSMGNVVLPQAKVHGVDEAPPRAVEGREYGAGAANATPMPGERFAPIGGVDASDDEI